MSETQTESRNIVLCADGTGNRGGETPDTNVYRMYQTIDLHGGGDQRQQITFYDNGVGTNTNKYLRALGGALGFGFGRNIRDLYEFLARNYEPGDAIYLFGFSRGAATVRAFAGMLQNCGLIDKKSAACQTAGQFDYDKFQKLIAAAFNHYRNGTGSTFQAEDFVTTDVRIRFMGVWDTVSALGFPYHRVGDSWLDDILERPLPVWLARGLDKFFNFGRFAHTFYEYTPNKIVDHVYHAIAIDDERKSFLPRVWDEFKDNADSGCKITQVWFTGMHSDVGGSYNQPGLAYETMAWMMLRAQHHGLYFSSGALEEARAKANVHGQLHNSRDGFAIFYRYAPRDIVQLCNKQGPDEGKSNLRGNIQIHKSVFDRMERPTDRYAPGLLPERFEIVDTPLVPEASGTESGTDGSTDHPHAQSAYSRMVESSDDKGWGSEQSLLRVVVRQRRLLYRVFADSFLLLVVVAGYLWHAGYSHAGGSATGEAVSRFWRLGLDAGNPILVWVTGHLADILNYVTPLMFEPFVQVVVVERPTILVLIVVWFFVVLRKIKNRLRERSLAHSVTVREKIRESMTKPS